MSDADSLCIRAGIEMTRSQWLSMPKDIRDRYWKETKWGELPPSPELCEAIRQCLNQTSSSR